MEKAYCTMRNSGAAAIAIGIVVLVIGVASGVLSIVGGAKLLRDKNKILF